MKKLKNKFNEDLIKVNIQIPQSWAEKLRVLAAYDTISGRPTSFQDKIRIALDSYLSVRGNEDECPY